MAGETPDTTTVDPNPIRGGILCPECGCPHHEVCKTEQSESSFWGKRKQYIRRTRRCRHCKLYFKTREVVEPDLPRKIKSVGDADKVRKILEETMENIMPTKPSEGLVNPFLPEK